MSEIEDVLRRLKDLEDQVAVLRAKRKRRKVGFDTDVRGRDLASECYPQDPDEDEEGRRR